MKAAAKLSETEKCIAGGQAYNISDNCPMEPYQFIKPLFDAMEQPLPWIPLPFFLVYIAAYILEILHYAVGVYPIFTRNEIVKVTNSHYCKMDKAINELGYSPKTYKVSFIENIKKVVNFEKTTLRTNGIFGAFTKCILVRWCSRNFDERKNTKTFLERNHCWKSI